MAIISLTEVYKLTNSCKEEDGQKFFLKAKYGDNHLTLIHGIPSDIDLKGEVEVHTYHLAGKDEQNVDEAKPDVIKIYTNTENKKDLEEYVLYRKDDGTYRLRTEDEAQRTNQGNMRIIKAVLEGRDPF